MRRARIEANSFEVLIAALCLLSAVSYFLVPGYLEQAPIGRAGVSPWLQLAWAASLGGSSLGILVGLWMGRANLETAGLLLLSSATAIQTLTLADVAGWQAITSTAVFLAVCWSCLVRARILWRFGKRD